ncbi:MAG: flagellin [Agathobaculum sp.]|uniref:flagellin N-terminal helical domain-containing protein n=1 Tax=Agathobaculum sp. TaxID=2048138 RepID=UPI002A814C4B|nr:flagellin [Agathobaculum sp.]MDY3711580.1 flagellin [Agathobaculum sp.]
MRIQHNIMAMNAYRNYTTNTSALSKNLEKLSSGYKINRAGDDAAGLAISEKMRAQITGLTAASKNVKDGISLVKTAEGAMQEIHDMLNRMDYLATQSANGTYDNDVDRANLQKEVESLRTEIDRIADSANFNGIKLLNGELAQGSLPTIGGLDTITPKITTATGNAAEVSYQAMSAAPAASQVYTNTITFTDANGQTQKVELKLTARSSTTLLTENGTAITVAGTPNSTAMANAFLTAAKENTVLNDAFTIKASAAKLTFTAKDTGANSKVDVVAVAANYKGTAKNPTLGTKTPGANEKATYDLNGFDLNKVFTVNGQKFAFTNASAVRDGKVGSDVNLVVTTNTSAASADIKSMADVIMNKTGVTVEQATTNLTFVASDGNGGLDLQIGDTAQKFNKLNVSVGDMHAKSLGIGTIDIGNQTGAADAIDKIKTAINSVSSTRGDLGAIQNRLEHTQNNLSVMTENIQDAESTIRDTDVADEMMKYTKNNILIQSAQAMLAQANQVPQGVLQLLQ